MLDCATPSPDTNQTGHRHHAVPPTPPSSRRGRSLAKNPDFPGGNARRRQYLVLCRNVSRAATRQYEKCGLTSRPRPWHVAGRIASARSAASLGKFSTRPPRDTLGAHGRHPRPVRVNSSPVLTLWATAVAELLGYPPETALTLERFVAGPSARTKTRRLGIMDEAQEAAEQNAAATGLKLRVRTVRLLGRDIPVLPEKERATGEEWRTQVARKRTMVCAFGTDSSNSRVRAQSNDPPL